MKLQAIAKALGLTLENAAADLEITAMAPLEAAGPGEMSFVADAKHVTGAHASGAGALIVDAAFPAEGRPVLRSKNPYLDFARALELFYQPPHYEPGVHRTAVVHGSAKIGERAHIGPYVVIDEDVEIGEDAVILAHVVIYRGVRIGKRFLAHAHAVVREFCLLGDDVILQNGVVIGADGFGFARAGAAGWYKIPQSGRTVIGNCVEVQALSTVDRATMGETRIGNGTKIDNQVQIGHGAKVGEHTMICAQCGLGGTSSVGNSAILAGQVGVTNSCHVGDECIITAKSGVHGELPPKTTWSGIPAFDNKQWLRSVTVFNKLPELARMVKKLAAGKE